jgi:hypothetical protein
MHGGLNLVPQFKLGGKGGIFFKALQIDANDVDAKFNLETLA